VKTGKTLTELAAELTRQQDAKHDYIADTDVLSISPDEGCTKLRIGDQELEATDNCHRQIGTHVGIPAKYYDRLRNEAPDLLAENVNHWFKANPAKRLVRTLDGKARAFLSDRYRCLDNFDLANAILPVIQESKAEIVSCDVTERKFYLKAIIPDIKVEIPPAGKENFVWGEGHTQIDVLQPGVSVTNSETGFGALAAVPLSHTVHCSNLAVWSEGQIRRTHLGKAHVDSADSNISEIFSDETKKLSDRALFAQLGDVVRASLSGELFDRIVEQIRASRGLIIERPKSEIIEIVQEKFALTDDEGKSVLDHLVEGSAYGLSNAITRAAEDASCYDRASELERVGAKIIELPRNQWQELAVAA